SNLIHRDGRRIGDQKTLRLTMTYDLPMVIAAERPPTPGPGRLPARPPAHRRAGPSSTSPGPQRGGAAAPQWSLAAEPAERPKNVAVSGASAFRRSKNAADATAKREARSLIRPIPSKGIPPTPAERGKSPSIAPVDRSSGSAGR